MDKQILKAKKDTDKKFDKLLKEDKKLDKKRDTCEADLKMAKKKK